MICNSKDCLCTFQATYFARDDVALHGFAKRFRENSDEERGHAMKLISYQNMRGGRVVFQDVCKPSTQEWNSALHAIGKYIFPANPQKSRKMEFNFHNPRAMKIAIPRGIEIILGYNPRVYLTKTE